MQERRHLKVDERLTEQFWTVRKEDDPFADISITRPASHDKLREFIEGSDWAAYKNAVSKSIDELVIWANANGISSQHLSDLKEKYLEYSGTDNGVNKVNFPMYQAGLPGLAIVAKLLKDERIPLDYRKFQLFLMAENIGVCGPGAVYNIGAAIISLSAFLNINVNLMAVRRKMIEELVGLYILEHWPDVPRGNRIHYVAATINRYGEAFGVNAYPIDDIYIGLCAPAKLDELFDHVAKEIPKLLRVENFLEKVIAMIPSIKDLAAKKKLDDKLFDDFSSQLNVYGEEQPGQGIYTSEKVVTTYGEVNDEDEKDYDKTRENETVFTWSAQYTLFLSIWKRLLRGGFVLEPHAPATITLSTGTTVHFYPQASLLYSSVHQPKNLNPANRYHAFLPYCIDVLCSKNNAEREALLELIAEYFTPKQKKELYNAAIAYVNSDQFKLSSKSKQMFAAQCLYELAKPWVHEQSFGMQAEAMCQLESMNPKIMQLAEKCRAKEIDLVDILNRLPASHCDALLIRLREQGNADKILTLPKNLASFVKMLNSLPPSCHTRFLELVSSDAFEKLFLISNDGKIPPASFFVEVALEKIKPYQMDVAIYHVLLGMVAERYRVLRERENESIARKKSILFPSVLGFYLIDVFTYVPRQLFNYYQNLFVRQPVPFNEFPLLEAYVDLMSSHWKSTKLKTADHLIKAIRHRNTSFLASLPRDQVRALKNSTLGTITKAFLEAPKKPKEQMNRNSQHSQDDDSSTAKILSRHGFSKKKIGSKRREVPLASKRVVTADLHIVPILPARLASAVPDRAAKESKMKLYSIAYPSCTSSSSSACSSTDMDDRSVVCGKKK